MTIVPAPTPEAAKVVEVRRMERPKPNGARASEAGSIDAGDLDWTDMPPREWLLGTTFCKEFISMLMGSGGAGKTALRYAQYLSLATGRSLTGEHVFRRSRVLIVSLEDGARELKRRLRAACIHHGIEASEIASWLRVWTPAMDVGKLVKVDERGNPSASTFAATLRTEVRRHRVDLVGLDPFVKAHGVDENSNTLVDMAMRALSDIAITEACAVDIIHHNRKGTADPGNADMGRGASATRDAARLASTLTTMSAEEAQTFGVDEKHRRSYVRLDAAKVNLAPANEAKWFQLVGVKLGNATADYPAGDEVQTVVSWTPPGAFDGVGNIVANAILSDIEAGLPDGNRYTDAARAGEREAWRVVVKHAPDKPEKLARDMVKRWMKTGVLVAGQYENPVTRKKVSGLRLDATKRPS